MWKEVDQNQLYNIYYIIINIITYLLWGLSLI